MCENSDYYVRECGSISDRFIFCVILGKNSANSNGLKQCWFQSQQVQSTCKNFD